MDKEDYQVLFGPKKKDVFVQAAILNGELSRCILSSDRQQLQEYSIILKSLSYLKDLQFNESLIELSQVNLKTIDSRLKEKVVNYKQLLEEYLF